MLISSGMKEADHQENPLKLDTLEHRFAGILWGPHTLLAHAYLCEQYISQP